MPPRRRTTSPLSANSPPVPPATGASTLSTHLPAAPSHPLDTLVQGAIATLRIQLSITAQQVASHAVTIVGGLEQPAAVDAFAKYALVVGICHGIRINLALAMDLLGGGPAFASELQQDVVSLIGPNNGVDASFCEDQRNPWFTECLGHLLLNVSRHLPDLGPPGQVQALTHVHADVHNHGLDLVGLHLEQALLGLNISEAKASEKFPSKHGSATATLFAEVDRGERDAEIRATVQILREALSVPMQALVTRSFWRGQRAYLAVISYGSASSFTPARARPAYGSLAVGAQRVRLIAVPLSNYKKFFDDVADAVRGLVPSVAAMVP